MSSRNEFDILLRKKLREEEFEYDPESWQRLSQLMPPSSGSLNRNKRWLLFTSSAAVIGMALSVFFFFKFVENRPAQMDQLAQNKQPAAGKGTQNGVSPEYHKVIVENEPERYAQSAGNLPVTRKEYTPVVPAETNSNEEALGSAQHVAILPPAAQSPAQPDDETGDKGSGLKDEDIVVIPKEEVQAAQQLMGRDPAAAPEWGYDSYKTGSRNANVTSVGLGGGMSYGNLNAGYAIGVSARTKIAGDFFVDGTVAMLYNNNTSNTAINNGPSLNDDDYKFSRPGSFAQTVAAPAISPIQRLYYVQFNPSVGYQLDPNIAFSVGGDFQQMLNKNEEVVLQASNQAKILPNFDIGLTTKSEFSITPNIQAGLVYREGLNNLIKSEHSRYVNRRYIQVQFKYNLPVSGQK